MVLLSGCASREGVEISGEIKGAKNGTLYLLSETEKVI
jgi:hypothetical protein